MLPPGYQIRRVCEGICYSLQTQIACLSSLYVKFRILSSSNVQKCKSPRSKNVLLCFHPDAQTKAIAIFFIKENCVSSFKTSNPKAELEPATKESKHAPTERDRFVVLNNTRMNALSIQSKAIRAIRYLREVPVIGGVVFVAFTLLPCVL